MRRKIIKYPKSVLKKEGSEIPSIENISNLIEDMKETLKKEGGVGLAGPQVGESKKVFIIKNGEDYLGFINPKITYYSDEKITTTEGCLSFPGLWIDVERSKKVKVELTNENGQRMEIEAEGPGAVVFQHEIDHLYGTTFIDRLPPIKKIVAKLKYFLKRLFSND